MNRFLHKDIYYIWQGGYVFTRICLFVSEELVKSRRGETSARDSEVKRNKTGDKQKRSEKDWLNQIISLVLMFSDVIFQNKKWSILDVTLYITFSDMHALKKTTMFCYSPKSTVTALTLFFLQTFLILSGLNPGSALRLETPRHTATVLIGARLFLPVMICTNNFSKWRRRFFGCMVILCSLFGTSHKKSSLSQSWL